MSEPADDEISLLDLLLVIAENWILLVLLPLAVGAITYGVLVAQPQALRSQAVLAIPPATVEAFIAEALEGGIYSAAMTPAPEGVNGLMVSEGSDPHTSALVLNSDNREDHSEFQVLVNDLVAFGRTAGASQAEDEPSERMVELEQRLELRDAIIARLETAVQDLAEDGTFDAEAYSTAAMALDRMLTQRDADADELESLRADAVQLTADLEIAAAEVSGPDRIGRSPLLLAILALLGSGFVVLVVVFIKSGLKSAMQDTASRQKLDRIKNAFLLRKQAN